MPQNGVKLAGPFFCCKFFVYKPDIQFQTSPLVTSVWTHSHNSFGQESGIDVPERDGNNRMEGRHREIVTNRFDWMFDWIYQIHMVCLFTCPRHRNRHDKDRRDEDAGALRESVD